ncbi:chitinase-like protein PB1E7.04c [Homarus americanus]|uniref:chitinase-like protein PB1E7.04c n=1 Tax=Homarus americanus TaxID=6706 RepID=UPI001C4772E6|nr:chitinase-like protein PB1E7.04c [Homarus americanus]
MDSSSDDEIFFGPITKKEEQIAKKFQNRRTEVFPSMPLFRRRSAAPSLESLEENDAQKCSHDSDTSQAIHVQDVSSNLSSTGSGQFSLDDDSVHRNSSHLSHSVPSSEPEEQEALFVFTSHKGVKRVSQDTSTDVSLCVAVSESDSQKSFSWQNLSENSCTSAMSGSLHTSCDSALHTNSHSDMSNDESKIFDNESIISKAPVDLSSQSIETHSSRFSRPIVEYEEKLKGIPGLSKALMKILVAVKEETYVGGVSVSDAGTKTSVTVPETSVTVPETSVTVPETSVTVPETSITVPETSVTVPETSVTVPETSVTVPETLVTVPETSTTVPETSVTVPETSVTVPETSITVSETSVTVPETSVTVPVTSVTVPETSITVPETSVTVPETSVTVPETSVTVPETSVTVPETSLYQKHQPLYQKHQSLYQKHQPLYQKHQSLYQKHPSLYQKHQSLYQKHRHCTRNISHCTETQSPETSVTVPETSVTVPETSITKLHVPETSVTVPETSVTVPETSVTVPETSTTVPETSVTVPETSVTVPETSVTVPETSVTVPAAIYIVLETTASESETPEDGLETTHNISDTTVNVPVTSVTVPEISVTVPESTDSEFEAIDFVPSKVICEGDLGVSCEQRLQEPQINKDFMCEIENESEKISKPTLSDGTTNNILPIIQDSAADSCQTIQTTCNDIRETSSGEMNNASTVRLSYFSGLDVINVDSNEVYGDFSIEDNLHTAIDCGEDLSHEDSLSLDDLHVESYGSANKAVIVSLSDYSQISTLSCNSRSLSLSAPESHHSNNSIEKIQGYKSPEHESFSPQNLNISKKSFDTSSESVQGTQSPCPKFNDTIEEMEMMLKYGLSYGEGNQKKVVEAGGSVGKDSSDVKVPDNKDNTFENIADDPIVCSTRSSSIASAVSNFQPVLESTRASSYQEHFMTPRVHVEDVGSNETRVIFSPSKALSEIKKGPPPKPPRKFCSPDVSPQKNSCHKTPTQCILKSFSVGAKETELINVHKMSTRRQIPQVSKITTPKQVKGDKIKFYTPKQPSVIQSSGRTPSSAPPTGLGLANSGSSTKFQKISRPGQSPANTPNLPRSATRFQPHTPVSRHHTPTIQKSSNVLKKQPTPYSSLPPRPTPNKIGKFIMKQPSNRGIKQYTPQERSTQTQLKVNSASKAPSSSPFKINNLRFKSGMNIESPVAKYLKENPPPPFLVNVKSRHKISPLKTKDECSPRKKPHQLVNQTESKEHHAQYQEAPRVTEVVETSFAKREVALTRIQDNLNRLGLRMKSRQTSEEEELVQPVHINKKENVLPKAMYSSAVPIILNKEDNKENERLRRRMKMLTDNQPALVMKHKGHRMMSKVTFEENLIDGLSPKDSRSPTHKKGVISFPEPRPSLTGSLLEVSIYESHEAQYTNALK